MAIDPRLCRPSRSWLAALTALLLFATCGIAQAGSSRILEIDKYVQPYVRTGNFSGAIRISKDGELLFEKAYGFADREKHIRNSAETITAQVPTRHMPIH